MNSKFKTKDIISVIIVVIQLFDIFIHTVTNQFELVRVLSNVVIILWILFLTIKPNSIISRILSTISISIYLVLNFSFIFENGLVNPTNNSLRFTLIVLVVLTSILSFTRYALNIKEYAKSGGI